MKKILVFLFLIKCSFSFAQNVDLTSVDEFFKIADCLKNGKEVNMEQWHRFDSSAAYSIFSDYKDNRISNIVKSTMQSVFGDLNRDKESENIISLESLVRANYEEINENYLKIKEFRHSYDFGSLISNAKSRLQSFLGCDSLDTSVKWKPVYFLFLSADGKDMDDALVIDFNLIYKMTEEQRINFLAHEFFHVYRGHFENHEFNYANDINFAIDMIANEGIADQIDKYMGYREYYSSIIGSKELAEEFVSLYSKAEQDITTLQTILLQYADKQIDKNTCIDKLLEIYKYNGHALGFYMSNQIILAGLKQEMLKSFHNPYEFYRLYLLATNKNNGNLLSRKFLNYLKKTTEQYYH
jgi:hypothetical protein